jgi:sugar O-acyltransferase (sialic acid O-acetyltransferase NeuD family)
MMEKEKIFVFGASGHAKVVIDIIEQQGLYDIAFLVDDDPVLKGSVFCSYSVIGGKTELLGRPDSPRSGIVAIGSNRARTAVAQWLTANGFKLVMAVHPSACLGSGVSIGEGTVVMAGAVINSDAAIGRNVIINTRSGIDHDCVVGDSAHIAPGSTLCGTVTVGEGSFVCAGATVIPNLKIGAHVTVGAGSTVIRDVSDGLLVAGVPASEFKGKKKPC